MIMKFNTEGDTMIDLVAVKENLRKIIREWLLLQIRYFYVIARNYASNKRIIISPMIIRNYVKYYVLVFKVKLHFVQSNFVSSFTEKIMICVFAGNIWCYILVPKFATEYLQRIIRVYLRRIRIY